MQRSFTKSCNLIIYCELSPELKFKKNILTALMDQRSCISDVTTTQSSALNGSCLNVGLRQHHLFLSFNMRGAATISRCRNAFHK